MRLGFVNNFQICHLLATYQQPFKNFAIFCIRLIKPTKLSRTSSKEKIPAKSVMVNDVLTPKKPEAKHLAAFNQ
jgi:hypothetical protein